MGPESRLCWNDARLILKSASRFQVNLFRSLSLSRLRHLHSVSAGFEAVNDPVRALTVTELCKKKKEKKRVCFVLIDLASVSFCRREATCLLTDLSEMHRAFFTEKLTCLCGSNGVVNQVSYE